MKGTGCKVKKKCMMKYGKEWQEIRMKIHDILVGQTWS